MESKFYNEEYEKVLLACLLMDNTIIDAAKGKVTKDCFFNAKYKLIYETIVKQYETEGVANLLTLTTALSNFSITEMASITDAVASTENWEVYAGKIKELYTARKMKHELMATAAKITGENNSEIISTLNRDLVGYMGGESDGCSSIANMCISIPEKIMATYKSLKDGKTLLGYDSGYDQLNEILDGFQTSNLYVLGARPSIGKTAFALNLIGNICESKTPVAAFSLEMSAEQLFYRLIAQNSTLQIRHIQKGFCFATKPGIVKFQNAMQKIFEYPLNIYDRDVDTDAELYAKIRYEAKVKGTKVFVIDHLGLIGTSDPNIQRYIQVGNITKTLHKMAKELDVCIILLCQLGREAEGKEPTLNLLRESGNIEQDADVIMFLHRERDMQELNVPTNVIVAKNREGRIGKAEMVFELAYSKFVEASSFRNDEVGECPKVAEEKEVKQETQGALF